MEGKKTKTGHWKMRGKRQRALSPTVLSRSHWISVSTQLFFPLPLSFPPTPPLSFLPLASNTNTRQLGRVEVPVCFCREQRDTHALRLCPAQLFHFRRLRARRCSHLMLGRSASPYTHLAFTHCWTFWIAQSSSEREWAVDVPPLAPVTHPPRH